MKILSAKQIRAWDAFTIQHEPISSIDLMERAARSCSNFLVDNNYRKNPVKIFCGKGNNGGDGLAIARDLISEGLKVNVYILELGAKGTEDFQANLQQLHHVSDNIHFIQSNQFFPSIAADDILIDALFGSGLNRPPEALGKELINYINQSKNKSNKIISVDVPSGMFIDKSSSGNAVIIATHTLTFQCTKLCFLMAENAPFFGKIHILDIGLHKDFLQTLESNYHLTGLESVKKIYTPRNEFAHKGTNGHALLIAGNKGKMGAALMAVKACLRSGAGLTTLSADENFFNTVHSFAPEAMCSERNELIQWNKFSATGIGPGLGTEANAASLVKNVLENGKRITFDADALNILSKQTEWLQKIPAESILTPHPKEFERLFGKTNNEFETIELAIELTRNNSFILVLKSHHTLVAANGQAYFNTTGNAGMAKGGSGDVLTGIITALSAQKYTAVEAAILGVFIHGLAADLALEKQSEESLLPTDIIEHLGKAFNFLHKMK